MQPTNLQSEYIKDETTNTSGARIFSEFSKHLIYHVFVVSSLIKRVNDLKTISN